MAVDLRTTHYRFGINELAESTHGWYANEDANPSQGTIAVDTTFLLRFTVQESGGTAAGNVDQQFQCNLNGGTWQNITTTSSIVKAVTTTVFANGADLTKRLSGTGTFESSGDGGTHDGLSGGAQNDIAASGNSETECALQIVSGDVVNGDVVNFRLTSPDFTITNDVTPSITVSESVPVEVFPGTGEITFTGYSPTAVASDHINVTPGVGEITLTGYSPTVVASDNQIVLPGTGEMSFTGYAPVVQIGINVSPGTGQIDMTGFSPVVSVTDHKVMTPGTGEITITGYAPAVVIGVNVYPDVGSIILEGFAPTVATTDHKNVLPGVGELTFTGYAPTVTAATGTEVFPGTGEIAITGYAPVVAVTQNIVVTPGTGEMVFTGYSPLVSTGIFLRVWLGSSWEKVN